MYGAYVDIPKRYLDSGFSEQLGHVRTHADENDLEKTETGHRAYNLPSGTNHAELSKQVGNRHTVWKQAVI